jgi:hypothetical protein
MFGLPTSWLAVGLAGAALVAAFGVQSYRLNSERADHAETRQQWADARAVQQEAARIESERQRAEEQRRAAANQEQDRADHKTISQLRADAAAGAAVAQRLRERIAAVATSAGQASSNPGAPGISQAAEPSAGMFADLYSRLESFETAVAGFADASRAAGLSCERRYESLSQ